jgi:tetratricopeptide (TPR) repeat protein
VPAALAGLRNYSPLMDQWWQMHVIARRIRELGLQTELLADLRGWGGQGWLPMIYLRGILSLDVGDFQTAADDLAKALASPDLFYGETEAKPFVQLSLIPIQRLLARPESDFDTLGGELASDGARPAHRLALEYLAGEIDWATAQKRVALTKDGERLYFFKALQELAEGDHDAARGHLKQALDTKAPGPEAFAAKSLLTWYERQTPAALQAMHRAPPIKARQKKREANDDF